MSNSQQETRADVKLLPEFDNPPINELVCGVQFDDTLGWRTPHFGLFWTRVQREYPHSEDQLPLALLPDPMEPNEEPRVAVKSGPVLPPLRRVWLIDESRQYLMQLDPPRFLHNWRRVNDSFPYPRFSVAYDRFKRSLSELDRFFEEQSLKEQTRYNQYELSYINHIVSDDEHFPKAAEKYISFYAWNRRLHTVEAPVALSTSLRFPLGGKRGMLSVSAKHGTRKSDGKQVLIIELHARGTANPSGGDMDDWFSIAHEAIVKGFVELTTPEAHKLWGRTV